MKRQKKKKVAKKMEPNKKTDEKKAIDGKDEKVFDIASPGKSMPSASSRPLIVTHKPNVEDPMVAPKNTEAEQTSNTKADDMPSAGEGIEMVMAAPKKNRIEPLHTDIVPDDMHAEIPEGDESEASEDEPEASTELSEDQKSTDQSEDDEVSEEISDVASGVTTKKEAQNEAAKKEAEIAKRQAEVESLVNNKQFFVPINAVQKRRSINTVIILIILVLAVIGFFAALDAGVLDIGLEPPTDIL